MTKTLFNVKFFSFYVILKANIKKKFENIIVFINFVLEYKEEYYFYQFLEFMDVIFIFINSIHPHEDFGLNL